MSTERVVLPMLGWREWLALPALGLHAIRAKVDTGARSSSLHVDSYAINWDLEPAVVTFALHRADGTRASFTKALVDYRAVRDSGGNEQKRPFIQTQLQIAEQVFEIEINLANRQAMLFPMLLGRTAVAKRFCVDPAQSFLLGEPAHAMEAIR